MASIKQATSALLETAVIIPLATAKVAQAIAVTGVDTINQAGSASNKMLEGVNDSLDIALSEIKLVKHRTLAENEAILDYDKEYFKSEEFKTQITARAKARYQVDEEELKLF